MIPFLTGTLFGASIALVLCMMTRRKPGITKHRRRYRDIPLPEGESVREAEVGGIRYEHLGMTGEEA